MRRFAVALLALLAVAGTTNVARAETATGAAYVSTLPGGADIWVDGTYVGRSPVYVDALLPGHHALTISKAGWVLQEGDVDVKAGGVAISTTQLTAGPRALAGSASGTVVVRTMPAHADVDIDGKPAKRGKPVQLPAGTHHATLTTSHGKTTRAFLVLPDTATELVLQEPRDDDSGRSGVVAPAADYLPADAITVEGKKIVLRYGGRVGVAHLGETEARVDGTLLVCDAAPEEIGGKLYLPLELLEKMTAPPDAKSP
jgi:hypothetical protein